MKKGCKMSREPCSCNPCGEINDNVVCQTFAQSASRFNEASNQAAAMAINNQQNLQNMYNAKAQQTLEKGSGERTAEMLGLLGSINSRIGGFGYPGVAPAT